MKYLKIVLAAVAVLCTAVSAGVSGQVEDVARYRLDSLEGVISRSGLEFDAAISSDGNGAVKIVSSKPQKARLFETGDIDVENTRLIYSAKIRTENVDGRVYLEMLCHFDGKGEFFSRALNDPISGTTEWISQETPFFLQKGENPDNVKLNVVIEGTGTVWIDDIRLKKAPL
jgi:hypothetical protein